ncbi:Uncharacterised protein [uncultured archaeon]|nr:Uncharacterised protein [uncultured archaeon]
MISLIKDETGDSRIVGTILMVGIVVFLSVIVVAASLVLAPGIEKLPQSSISVQSYKETSSPDIKIQHTGGDRLMAGDWWISIVPAGEAPNFRRSSTDFCVGDQIITATLTSGEGNYIVTNGTVSTDGTVHAMNPGEYDVKIIIYPFQSLVLDKVIEVR